MTVHSIEVDTADFVPNQVIAPDEARYQIGSSDTEQQHKSCGPRSCPLHDNFLQLSWHKAHKMMPDDEVRSMSTAT